MRPSTVSAIGGGFAAELRDEFDGVLGRPAGGSHFGLGEITPLYSPLPKAGDLTQPSSCICQPLSCSATSMSLAVEVFSSVRGDAEPGDSRGWESTIIDAQSAFMPKRATTKARIVPQSANLIALEPDGHYALHVSAK